MNSLEFSSFVSISDLPEDLGFSTFFWHIFKKKRYTDITFVLRSPDGSENTIEAHKIVLALRSPHFADLFCGEMINNIIDVSDVNPEAFRYMIEFMYDHVSPIKSPKEACELYRIAIKFEVYSLMNECRQIINGMEILPTNVFDMLEVSEYLQNQSTKDKCMKVIQERTKEVMESYKFSEISPLMIRIFLSSPKLSMASELELLMWIFAWAKNRYSENSEFGSIRDAVEEFFPQLYFLSLSNDSFATLYRFHNEVFTKDEVISIFMNIAVPGSWKMPEWHNEKCPFRIYCETKQSEENLKN